MPPKKRCAYGTKCFITTPAHRMLFAHEEAVVIDLVSPSISPAPSVSASPVATDVVIVGSDGALVLTPSSPEVPADDRRLRLKKRRMVINSSESSEEEGKKARAGGDAQFARFLQKGAFGSSGGVSGGSTERAAPRWINAKEKEIPKEKERKKSTRRDEDDDEDLYNGFSSSSASDGGEEREDFDCPYCTLSFGEWFELEDHVASHGGRPDPPAMSDAPVASSPRGRTNRAARLTKRNQQKVLPTAPVAERKAPTKPAGPKTLEELVVACKSFSTQLEADLLDPSKQRQLIREQPKTFVENRHLQPHQIAGLNWLYLLHERSHNGILADEMGLGKTVQAIALLTHLKECGQDCSAIVVVPASVVSNWLAEIERWSPQLNTVMYYGTRDERCSLQLDAEDGALGRVDVYLTTYTTVISEPDRNWLRKRRAQYLIIDEAHEIRNSDSLRHKALAKLGCARRLLLTGTPLHNNLQELCSLLYFLNPTLFGSFKSFQTVLQDAGHVTAKNAQEAAIPAIRTVLAPFLLRRLKDDVLKLPEKKRFRVRCALSATLQKEVYEQLVRGSKEQWSEGGGALRTANNILMELRKAASHPLLLARVAYSEATADAIARTMHRQVAPYYDMERQKVLDTVSVMSDYQLHQICSANDCLKEHVLSAELLVSSSGKMQNLMKLLKQCQGDGKRVLVFSQMTRLLDIVQEALTHRGVELLRLDGQTPVLERQQLVDSFNADPKISVFLLSTKAGGVGITLTAAQAVVFLDLSFNPQWDRQAEDRAHRIGQEKVVSVYRLLTTGSIDESIWAVQEEKVALHNGVLQEGALAVGGEDDGDEKPGAEVKDLLQKYFAALE